MGRKINSIIRELPKECINKIAAGEIVHRPVNAIKEIIENSLDANATIIRLIIESCGINLIEIFDNGCGIANSNAAAVCKRFSTSKLHSIEDLSKIETFGFRGEALASISEVADVQITTFCPEVDDVGWRANYHQGSMIGLTIKNCAKGTNIVIKNLFKELKGRQSAVLQNVAEEKKAIIDLVTRYAIHYCQTVTFTMMDSSQKDLICNVAPICLNQCIGSFYGTDIERNLISIDINDEGSTKMKTTLNFSYAKTTTMIQPIFMLFVNNRLVDNQDLKKELIGVANSFFSQKSTFYFFYLSVKVEAKDIDVNTHPAKANVTLHFEDDINNLIVEHFLQKLRSVQKFSILDVKGISSQPVTTSISKELITKQTTNPRASQPTPKRPSHQVHTDSKCRQLDELLETSESNKLLSSNKKQRREMNLKSRLELMRKVSTDKSSELQDLIRNSVFVGIFDHDYALIQNQTKLIAINFKKFLVEMCYQFYLHDFGNFPPINILAPGNKIRPFIEAQFNHLKKYDEKELNSLTFNNTDMVIDKLMKHKAMYEDYFCLNLNETCIDTLPSIFPQVVPNLAYLGKFLIDVANKVDYDDEKECFRTFGYVLGDFYSIPPSNLKDKDVSTEYHRLVASKLYFAVKGYCLTPKWLLDARYFCQISDTQDLYKVFERC